MNEAFLAFIDDHTRGVDVRIDSEQELEEVTETRLSQGAPIDILLIRRPSFVPERAGSLGLQQLGDWTAIEDIAPELRRVGTIADDGTWRADEGAVFALPFEELVQNLVWYRPSEFVAAGYEPPTTYDELDALVEQMVADGETPWCAGYDVGGALDGAPGTDVVEALVLSDLGTAGFDEWVRGERRFQDPSIRRAFERYADLFLEPGHATGISADIADTDWFATTWGLFEADLCMMTVFMELPAVEATEMVGDDKAYFHFPPSRPGVEDAVMIGATLMVALTDRPEVRAVVDAISHPEKTAVVIEAGAPAISSANLRFDGSGLELNAPSRQLIEDMRRAVESDTLRFDASAQMPEPVWQAFNRGMLTLLDELLGEQDAATIDRVLDRVLAEIDGAWDEHRSGQPD